VYNSNAGNTVHIYSSVYHSSTILATSANRAMLTFTVDTQVRVSFVN